MKTKLPPGPIRPPGNYYLLDCVLLETSYRRAFEQTLVRKTWFRRFTRGSENLCRLSSGGSGCSDYELTRLYPNLTADNPRLMEVTVMSRRQADGSRLAGVFCRGYWEVSWIRRVAGRASAWLEGHGESYIFNGFQGLLTQLLVTAHPTCHGTGPTSLRNRPSFRHLNNLVHVFTERWQSQVHWHCIHPGMNNTCGRFKNVPSGMEVQIYLT